MIYLVLIAFFIIPIPFLVMGIKFQHSSFRARSLHKAIYNKAIKEFCEHHFHILYSEKDGRNSKEKRLMTNLQQATEASYCDVMISIISADKHLLTVEKQSHKLLNVVLTTATLDNYDSDYLSHIISSTIVLHSFNSDNDTYLPGDTPSISYYPYVPGSPLVIAIVIYIETSKRLKKVDKQFHFNGSKNVNTRIHQLEDILQRENVEIME
ncbi:hypothetical protein BIT28_19635 [Photobacterium proteolyticum]|uniref:Uncharacterized protein n=1 Tax=Photobacterium proteolyticum TaxID=1903952 RepID=A0A1Q9GHY9_9GAMM|nr:hypothetical protein [Photobacterium proteolyticum]OLQ74094.1 hypothetical protein BIT28_19635 [Photobacterium proteolyticum]